MKVLDLNKFFNQKTFRIPSTKLNIQLRKGKIALLQYMQQLKKIK